MAWIYLLTASIFEITWAVSLKYTNGFTRLWPTVINLIAMVGGIYLLSQAEKTIPVGTAYAVWTGIGAVGTAVLGIIFFGESRDLLRIICLTLIIAGIAGLKLTSAH